MTERTAEIGDNLLTSTERLASEHRDLITRLEDIERKAAQVPEIGSDEESGPWQEIIADADSLGRDIEAIRVREKDPFEKAVEITNGFFFGLFAPRRGQTAGRLNLARQKIGTAVQNYLMRKEAAERAERERIAAEERERQRKAEEARRAAEQAHLKAEEEGRKKAAANQAAKAAEAEAAASAAGARAFEAEQQAQAKPADAGGRNRSDGGTLASLKVEWDFRIDNIDKLPMRDLWTHIPRAAKEAAIRAYVRANAPKVLTEGQDWQPLTGVHMICKRGLQVR